jgi:hypothetical protein
MYISALMLAMAKRLAEFPESEKDGPRRYPWSEWTDGGVWEIQRGEDYDAETENMRANLHIKAKTLGQKVRTRKTSDGLGLVFQFLDSEEMEVVRMAEDREPEATREALNALYEDACWIYETAREEVTIPRRDGSRQKYAAIRFKRQIDAAHDEGRLVPAVAQIVNRPTLGLGHLAAARRPDLMLESFVVDRGRPYHRLFSTGTVEAAEERLREYRAGLGETS